MKKILSLLLALCFVISALFAVTACNDEADEKAEAPIKFSYTLVKENDDTYYSLKSVTISEKAKELVDKNDYDKLAELFNTAVEGYTAPETKYDKTTVRTLVVPTTYNNKAVKAISADAVAGLTFVKKIVVGENIEKIAEGAFSSLTSLEEIEIPFVGGEYNAKNEKKLFGYIFGTTSGDGLTACEQKYNDGDSDNTKTYYIPSSLKTVTVKKGNAKKTEELKYKIDGDKYVYSTDEGYMDIAGTEYTINEDKSEYAVSAYSFYNCTTVETVNLSGVTEIEAYTFYGCTGIKTLKVSDGVTVIGNNAYENCTSLKTLDLNNVTAIGDSAFKGCTSLGADYLDKANDGVDFTNVTSVGDYAFYGCTSLAKITNYNGSITKNHIFDETEFIKHIA